jgi:hypothetical protein
MHFKTILAENSDKTKIRSSQKQRSVILKMSTKQSKKAHKQKKQRVVVPVSLSVNSSGHSNFAPECGVEKILIADHPPTDRIVTNISALNTPSQSNYGFNTPVHQDTATFNGNANAAVVSIQNSRETSIMDSNKNVSARVLNYDRLEIDINT